MSEHTSERLYPKIKRLVVAIDEETIPGRTGLLIEMGFGHLSADVVKQGSKNDFADALLVAIVGRGQAEMEEFLRQLGNTGKVKSEFGLEDLRDLKAVQDAVAALSPEQWQDEFADALKEVSSQANGQAGVTIDRQINIRGENVTFAGDFAMGDIIKNSTTTHGAQAKESETDVGDSGPGAQVGQAGTQAPAEDAGDKGDESEELPAETLDTARPPPRLTRPVLQWFVNRVGELVRFRRMLAGRDDTQVLAITGLLGIGKTELCKRLQREADRQAVPSFYLDLSSEAFDDLWMARRTAMALGAFHFEALERELEEAMSNRIVYEERPLSDTPRPRPRANFEGNVTVKGDYAEGHIFKNIKFPEKDPEIRRLVHELVNDAFFADLARLGRAEGAVLLLDSYRGKEGMPEAHTWLKVQLLRRIGEGELPGVRVVIAGETYPPLESAGHAPVAELSLDPLPAAEVRRYLACRRPTISEASVTRIYEVTGGQPDQVALIADFEGELPEQLDPDKLHEIMVLGILEDKEGPMAETLRVAAIPEWFDDELLADLLDKRSVEGKRPQDLQVYSFVQEFEGGRFRFAPKVRHVLLRSWEMEDRPDLGALHECAAHHFDERAGQALSDRQRWEFQRQAAAHWLERDERTGLERVRALFEEAEPSYELSECQLLLARASDVEGLQAVTEAWLQYLAGRLALARNEFDKSSDLLGSALDEREADAELVALTNFCLGQLAAEQGHWDTAIDKYERSRPFFAGHQHSVWEGKVMLALGDVHLQQARALGGPLQPSLLQGKKGWRIIKALPALLVALPFVVFARLIQHWRLPLRHGMNYRNWTLARLLLTAQHWFSEALSRFESAGPEELVPDAQLRLAQTYYRLGWRDDARQLFKQALDDFRENNKAYRIAGVLRESAEMELRAANSSDTIEKTIKDLEESLQTFEDYGDIQSQAQVRALLGYAWLEKGEFERGLDLLQASLDGFSSIGDRLGIGYALHIMRSWMQYAEPPPERAERVKRVIARARIKAYLPRVPDRLAAAMELGASAGLIMLALVGAVLLGLGVLTPVPEIFAYLLSAGTVLKLLGLLILAILAFFLVFSGIGLVLIVWGSRQRLKPERLDRVVTTDNAISRVPYMGDEETRLDWRDAKTTVSVDRMLWRTPLPLLSDFWLFGQATEIQVPATTGWYGELRRDIEDHLQDQSVRPIRRGLDLHVFRNWLGLGFALSPVLVALGAALIWNQIVLPLPLELTAWLGIAAMFLGVMGLIAGPYWWLVLHPLWVRYHLAPRFWVPVVAGAIGAGIVAFAFFFRQWQPFYPIRNWLEWTVHPLGYVLLIVATLWVVTARDRARLFTGRGKAAYAMWQRGIATVLLAGAVGLAALFLRAEWVPYLPVYQAVAYYYHGEYEQTIRRSSQALAINANMVDGYYLRAAASIELERYEPAVYDLSQMIDSGSAINADYYLFRARAYQGLDQAEAACQDLDAALNAENWGLSKLETEKAEAHWQEWRCDAIHVNLEELEDASCCPGEAR